MAIQSSINSLLSQTQSLAAFYKGFEKAGDIIKGQEAQTEATKKLQESFEERFKKAYNIDDKTPLTFEQEVAISWAKQKEKETGHLVSPEAAMRRVRTKPIPDEERAELFEYLREGNDTVDSAIEAQAVKPEMQNEVARNLARASVEARTNSINKTKSNFDEHVASLIRYYGKGSGNP